MRNHAAWLLLSFAIMVAAVLAKLSDTVEKLDKRLRRLEEPHLGEAAGASAHGRESDLSDS